MPPARDANWIDGLRGMASLFVVIGHMCTSFAPHLHSPTNSPSEPPTLFQLPILRLCVSGRTAVALFFLITGYVNSIGPLSKASAGDYEGAFASIARSALARSGKLVLPVALATTISWVLAQTGAYQMTEFVDSVWIRQGHHPPAATWCDAWTSLVKAQIGTWTEVWNENYDGTQWTLILFLEGSMLVYLTVFSTVLVGSKARKAIFAAVYIYGWLSAKTGMHILNITCILLN
jgi:peptidoglycan/LPS O-acetylase OafA/YrhL